MPWIGSQGVPEVPLVALPAIPAAWAAWRQRQQPLGSGVDAAGCAGPVFVRVRGRQSQAVPGAALLGGGGVGGVGGGHVRLLVAGGWWLVALWADGRHKLSAAGVAVSLLANVAALSVENMQWARQWAWPPTALWQGDWCSSAAATNGPDQRGAVACPYRRSKWPTKRLRSPSLRS